jgi:hypothetical protein
MYALENVIVYIHGVRADSLFGRSNAKRNKVGLPSLEFSILGGLDHLCICAPILCYLCAFLRLIGRTLRGCYQLLLLGQLRGKLRAVTILYIEQHS